MTDTQTKEHVAEMKVEAPSMQLPAVAEPIMPADKHAKPRIKRERPESIINIATAIATITGEIGQISKQGYNKFHGYKYVTMENVLQKLTPLIGKHGLIIMQTEVSRAMFDDDRVVSVQYAFTIAHTSGEVWPDRPVQTGVCRCRDSKGGWDDKALNKCHTAARKYFLLALFQIATGDEDDADQGDNDAPASAKRPARPAPNVMGAPPALPQHDPQTGEIESAANQGTATDAAEPAPAPEQVALAGSGAAPSLEDQARAQAKKGEKKFTSWYLHLGNTEKRRLSVLGEELRGLMNEAGGA